jgi:hypothetical protein
MTKKSVILGVISDTHGLLRPEAVEALHGSVSVGRLLIEAGKVRAELLQLEI